MYKSICHECRPGQSIENELCWIQYKPSGRNYYKLNFSDDLQELRRKPQKISAFHYFPNLYKAR